MHSDAGEATVELAWPYTSETLDSRNYSLQKALLNSKPSSSDEKALVECSRI
ncbi:MAG: hypothetical protein HXX20_14270 [Chloroflexi bacterium]|nr:hypothetical protein [Chloroflexota bacterium]